MHNGLLRASHLLNITDGLYNNESKIIQIVPIRLGKFKNTDLDKNYLPRENSDSKYWKISPITSKKFPKLSIGGNYSTGKYAEKSSKVENEAPLQIAVDKMIFYGGGDVWIK